MPISIEEFNKLKSDVEAARDAAQQAAGGLRQAEEELKTRFGCNSVEEAEKRLAELEEEEKQAVAAYDAAAAQFKSDWQAYLERMSDGENS